MNNDGVADQRAKQIEIVRMEPFPPVPEGMSKRQWKRQCKQLRHEETKDNYNKVKKEKRKRSKENRRLQIKQILERGEEIPEELKRAPRVNNAQKDSGMKIIMDCSFDDLMNEKEIVSMSNQVTRTYSSNKRENHFSKITVASFDKRLKDRFDNKLKNFRYQQWRNFEFLPDEQCITAPDIDRSKMVYLTADTDEKIDTLEPDMTYIVGGIVDKNRHKCLCYNKAKELGIPTKRLPIDEFINLFGRRVLTTTHVIQIMLRYFDNKDWKEAFESIVPQRKLDVYKLEGKPVQVTESDADDDDEAAEAAEDSEESPE